MSDATETQDAVFALLADPASHDGVAVKRVDTHAAVLFLAGKRVFKVKRAVQFPFLDFSTLAKRKAACEAEIAVNQRYAPQIYVGVVPIAREPDGRLALSGNGEPIEWAVEMRRFDETRTLDHLADAGRIDDALADALGRAVANSHAGANGADARRWIAALQGYIDEHVIAFGEHSELFPAEENQEFASAGRETFKRIRPLLTVRGRQGLVRCIHGDLHLGNIVLLEGQPVLFDAIEFSDVIASGDVLYDLAFLLMDLIERNLAVAANIVFNRYLAETKRIEDLDALAALPFFLSMRAAIRAKVTAARLTQAKMEDRAEIERTARKYFDWARRFMAPPTPTPTLVAVGGLSGTGKSVLARSLAAAFAPPPGAVVLRSDVERKALFGKGELEPLPEAAYAPGTSARVYGSIIDKTRRTVAAGHSAIVDAVFARADERDAVEQAAKEAGVAFTGLFLSADIATRVARTAARRHDASDADAKVAREQETYQLGALRWINVDASGSPEQTLGRAMTALRSKTGHQWTA